uniref:exocyst complex component 7-like isoform X1 n=1 Tax=Myxine glutinosa TaxID=7769 RepID=UPI00358EF920
MALEKSWIRKTELEEKLRQEQDVLGSIKENLEKSDQLTNNMVGILSSFERRLTSLEAAIVPVHRETEKLQRLQDNGERTLGYLNHVIGYYHVAERTDKVIREGSSGRLDSYLQALDEVRAAVDYFTDNNPGSPELQDVRSLFERGKEALDADFSSLLKRHSQPYHPHLVLDALANDEDGVSPPGGAEEGSNVPVSLQEQVPENVLQDLVRIAHWLGDTGRNQDFMSVYYQIRSVQLVHSLQALRDYVRRGGGGGGGVSGGLAAGGGTPAGSAGVVVGTNTASHPGHYSPAMHHRRGETPTKKPLRRTAYIPGTLRKAQSLLKQHSNYTLEGKRGQPSLSSAEGKDEVGDLEIEAYVSCVSAFVKLAQCEYSLLTHVIPDYHHKKTFDSLIQDALDGLVAEGDGILAVTRRSVMRHDYSAVLTMLPLLRHLKACKVDFDLVLQGTAATTKNKLPMLIAAMETTGAKAVEGFADSIKMDPDKEYNMPKDGTVHELTSNAILFLQQLLDFHETAGAMLASQVLGCTFNIPLDPRDSSSSGGCSLEFSRKLLSSYVSKVLGNLQLNLLSKAKVYEDPGLRAVFLINNYNYTLKAHQRSELLQLVELTQPNLERTYEELIDVQLAFYRHSWNKVLDHISDRNMPMLQPGGKLKDKERQLIKERFKGFNDGLEEVCRSQKTWAVPDQELRTRLRQEVKRLVLSSYRIFSERYGDLPFSKTPAKYLKYNIDDVTTMMEHLFDTSA